MNILKTITYALITCTLLHSSSIAYAENTKPVQVIVSVKVIEFQATKGLETGFSAYYKKVHRNEPFGRVIPNGNAIDNADLTFPSSSASGLTVFLDRISVAEGEIEMVLQALADENKAEILFRPRAVLQIGGTVKLTTSASIPYEATQVVGATAVQAVFFKPTGITLNLAAKDLIDDDGDYETKDDMFIRLNINALVAEEGQRIVVALGAAGGDSNALTVPEFIKRQITTEVWIPEGEILVLGGLYRNSENKTLSTVPFLNQGENMITGLIDSFIPGNTLSAPLSTTFGNRAKSESRRELVFLLKAEAWSPSLTLGNELGFDDSDLFNIDLDDDSNALTSEDLVTDLTEPEPAPEPEAENKEEKK